MKIFDYLKEDDYEQLMFFQDNATGLKAIICVHNTTLGPALGGTRFWDYESEEDAIVDAIRLARGMTYKNSAAGLNAGGGKAVIIGDPQKIKSEELFRTYGRFVESLNGRFITGQDMNITLQDLAYIGSETDYIAGVAGKGGAPAPVTAFGVYRGLLAATKKVYGTEELKGKKVAVQGIGAVGYDVCKYLHKDGAELFVTDIVEENVKKAVEELGAKAVQKDEIYGLDCDIFVPCAMGAIINDNTIDQLKCKIIAGSANNQLAEERHGDTLGEKGILYVPDYVINSGGVINVYEELQGYDRDRAMARASAIYDAVTRIFEIAKRDNIPTYKAADKMAEERIQKISKINNIYI